MKKKEPKKVKSVNEDEVSATSPELLEREYKCLPIGELSVVFNSEDQNKVVEKLNEVIRKINGC